MNLESIQSGTNTQLASNNLDIKVNEFMQGDFIKQTREKFKGYANLRNFFFGLKKDYREQVESFNTDNPTTNIQVANKAFALVVEERLIELGEINGLVNPQYIISEFNQYEFPVSFKQAVLSSSSLKLLLQPQERNQLTEDLFQEARNMKKHLDATPRWINAGSS